MMFKTISGYGTPEKAKVGGYNVCEKGGGGANSFTHFSLLGQLIGFVFTRKCFSYVILFYVV